MCLGKTNETRCVAIGLFFSVQPCAIVYLLNPTFIVVFKEESYSLFPADFVVWHRMMKHILLHILLFLLPSTCTATKYE